MKNSSIVRRWGISVLATTILITITIGVFTCFFIKQQYYSSVETTLSSRANSLVMTYFNSQTFVVDEAFNDMANDFVNDFSDKNIMEVWVIDSNGDVVVSSTGFSVESEPIPDYGYAKTSDNGKGEWVGNLKNGERIMALTYILPENEKGVSGAIRYIISLEDINSQIWIIWIIISTVVILVIGFVVTSGVFFIKSIIKKISIIVPMYNTPIKYFKELVDSVLKQTYSNLELCLADGSPEKNEESIFDDDLQNLDAIYLQP